MTFTSEAVDPAPAILTVPGLNNSGPGHWQTLWEQQLPGCHREVARIRSGTPDRRDHQGCGAGVGQRHRDRSARRSLQSF